MSRRRRILLYASTVTICLCVGALAGPILPGRLRLPVSIQSLAGVQSINIVIKTIPKELFDAGLTNRQVRSQLKRRIEAFGIQALDDKAGRQATADTDLGFGAQVTTEPSVPNAIGFMCLLEFEQAIHVKRLGADMRAPTGVAWFLDVRDKASLSDAAREGIDRAAEMFLNSIKLVSS